MSYGFAYYTLYNPSVGKPVVSEHEFLYKKCNS